MPRKPRDDEPEIVDVLALAEDPVAVDEPAMEIPTFELEPAPVAARPAPEVELTAEQLRIRELEHLLATERGGKDPETQYAEPVAGGEPILIHVLEDGFTVLGRVWFRGQEIEFDPGGAAYRDTCDRFGRSWLELRGDEFAQVERYGKVMFRVGPWPGKSYLDAAKVPFEALKPLSGSSVVPTQAELEAAQATEAKRRRAAPRLPVR